MKPTTGLDREKPKDRSIPVTINNAFVLAVFTGIISFAAPRVYSFFVDQTADSASRAVQTAEKERTQSLLIAARDKQQAQIESSVDKLDRRVQSLEEWARSSGLRQH